MENSIEEDIKKAEELIKKCDKCKLTECINCEISWTEIASIRRIIDNYRNVLKENEELKNKLLDIFEGKKVIEEETPQYIRENYIPKDKIEEILDETEITDFNSLVEAFLKIRKLLESE